MILGLNIGFHDSSIACLSIKNGEVSELEVILSERILNKKNIGGFPFAALRHFNKVSPSEWSGIAESDVAIDCLDMHPKQAEENYAKKNQDYKFLIEALSLQKASSLYNSSIKFVPHHLCHVYSILTLCPFEKALVIVSDGAGSASDVFTEGLEEWPLIQSNTKGGEYYSVYSFENGLIRALKKEFALAEIVSERKLRLGPGLGIHFEYASQLIFNNWTQAGKVMGLSAAGRASPVENMVEYLSSLDRNLFPIFESKEEFDRQSIESFQRSADLAATVQTYFENEMMKRLENLKKDFPEFENLILVGGCALNGLLNMKIVKSGLYKNVFVPPFPNDEGIALGAAAKLAFQQGKLKFKRRPIETIHPYLGARAHDVALQEKEIPGVFKDYQVEYLENVVERTAHLLEQNKIVAWMQGRSEVGPRALGHRSILARTDIPNLKQHLNDHIKYREKFRPYGGTVLKELASTYFEVDENFHSPFMTFCVPVRTKFRDALAGVTHLDGTCRPQTLCREQNPLYYDLISECHKLFGLGVILNTSLNTMGKPIVETLEDALVFFEESQIEFMVVGNFLIRK